jgi:putative membrane protein
MFEIDEHLLSQILAIGLIVLLIVVFIGYIITAIFSKIMFDIFGVKAGLAFIPYYNTYRIYKEYKGRVWKKNWGISYIITFVIPMAVIGGFVFALINSPITSGEFYKEFAPTLILVLVVLIIAGLVLSVFNFILLFITYLPIFDTKGRRIVLYIEAGLTVLSMFTAFIFEDNTILGNIFSIGQFVFSIVFMVVYFVAATDIRARVRSGKYVLQEKLDYNNLNSYEIDSILKARDRKLVVPVMYNGMDNYTMGDYPYPVNNYPMNNNEDVNRIEYV